MDQMTEKYGKLQESLRLLGCVAVAFSGGADPAFCFGPLNDVLGENVIAVTAASCAFPKRELKGAEDFCRQNGIRHIASASRRNWTVLDSGKIRKPLPFQQAWTV